MSSSSMSRRELALSLPSHSVIDVTLRDGGFRTNFDWPVSVAQAVLRAAFSAGVSWCEVGYTGGVPDAHGVAHPGRFARVSPDLLSEVVTKAAGVPDASGRLAVMVHPGSAECCPDFAALQRAGVGMARFVWHPSWRSVLIEMHNAAVAAGLRTSINVAVASHYSLESLFSEVALATRHGSSVVYVADTCGSFTPGDVEEIFAGLPADECGFHAHDYLNLAVANSLAAVISGARWVDTSLLGLGRGAGNARTEIWAALRWRAGHHRIPDFEEVEGGLAVITRHLGGPKIADLISVFSGVANLAPPEEDALRSHPRPWSEVGDRLLGRK